MKKSHAGLWAGAAVLFLAAVYSVILFLVKTDFDAASWVLYGATMAAFLLVGLQAVASAKSGSGVVTDKVLGSVTAVYFLVQLIIGGIICMRFGGLPLTAVVIAEIVVLGAYLIITFLMYAVQSGSAAQDHNDQKAVQKMRLLESDVQGMADAAADPEIKKALKDLAEAIHYGDVASLPGLADVEGRIAQNVAALQEELAADKAASLARIGTLRRLLKERDRTAAILKR